MSVNTASLPFLLILADEKTLKREISPLLDIRDNYEKYILSMDEFDFSREGIKHMNIIQFLKEDTL